MVYPKGVKTLPKKKKKSHYRNNSSSTKQLESHENPLEELQSIVKRVKMTPQSSKKNQDDRYHMDLGFDTLDTKPKKAQKKPNIRKKKQDGVSDQNFDVLEVLENQDSDIIDPEVPASKEPTKLLRGVRGHWQ